MQGIHEHIVHFNQTHRTTTTVGDYELTINPYFEQPKWINRVGTVVSTPLSIKTPIQPGDQVLVVHTVLLDQVFTKQGHVENFFLIDKEKNYFRFEDNLIVMYRKGPDDKWKCNGQSIMVKPIQVEETQKEVSGITIPDMVFENEKGYQGYQTQRGVIAYANPTLENDYGIFVGDEIIFKKDREYEYDIDGELLWHMENNDILMYDNKFLKTEPDLSDAFT